MTTRALPALAAVRHDLVTAVEDATRVVRQDCQVSFEVFFQRFVDGRSASGGNAEAIEVLEAFFVRNPSGGVTGLRTGDGSADLLGLDESTGYMASHVEGRETWELLVRAARAAGCAIMPVGCPACVPSAGLGAHLPPELVADGAPLVVTTGDELMEAVRDA